MLTTLARPGKVRVMNDAATDLDQTATATDELTTVDMFDDEPDDERPDDDGDEWYVPSSFRSTHCDAVAIAYVNTDPNGFFDHNLPF